MKPIILDDGTVIPGDEDCKWLGKSRAKKLKTMEEIMEIARKAQEAAQKFEKDYAIRAKRRTDEIDNFKRRHKSFRRNKRS